MLEIRFDGVSQEFEGREVLHQVTCSFHAGRVTAIAGANGSGKSTLLRIAARLMLPYTRLTVRENLSFLLSARGAACGEEELKALTARVGLSPEVLSRTAGQLSTGMRQRVRLAALLGVDAEIWLLDEPGLALDERGRALLMNEVRRAAERGRLVLWATNDREEREAADACIDLSCDVSGCL